MATEQAHPIQFNQTLYYSSSVHFILGTLAIFWSLSHPAMTHLQGLCTYCSLYLINSSWRGTFPLNKADQNSNDVSSEWPSLTILNKAALLVTTQVKYALKKFFFLLKDNYRILLLSVKPQHESAIGIYSLLKFPPISLPIPPLSVDAAPLFEFPESYGKFPLAI